MKNISFLLFVFFLCCTKFKKFISYKSFKCRVKDLLRNRSLDVTHTFFMRPLRLTDLTSWQVFYVKGRVGDAIDDEAAQNERSSSTVSRVAMTKHLLEVLHLLLFENSISCSYPPMAESPFSSTILERGMLPSSIWRAYHVNHLIISILISFSIRNNFYYNYYHAPLLYDSCFVNTTHSLRLSVKILVYRTRLHRYILLFSKYKMSIRYSIAWYLGWHYRVIYICQSAIHNQVLHIS